MGESMDVAPMRNIHMDPDRQALSASMRRAKDKGKGKNKDQGKDKPDTEMTCYYCSEVGHRKADLWSWKAAQRAAKKEAAPKQGVKKEMAAMEVGSPEAGPLSACTSESWILSVQVAEIDGSWTTHNEG